MSVKRENIDNISVFKNPTNTLSYEEDGLNSQNFKQLFQTTDGIITQQLITSYDNVNINLVDCQGNTTNLPIVKKTSNIDITDVRDITIS